MKKHILILVLTGYSLLTVSCSKGSDNSTIFEGKVIKTHSNVPVRGYIEFIGWDYSLTPGQNKIITQQEQIIADDGSFSLTFEGDTDIIWYEVYVFEENGNEKSLFPPIDLDCGQINCDRIEPGKNYNDFIIMGISIY